MSKKDVFPDIDRITVQKSDGEVSVYSRMNRSKDVYPGDNTAGDLKFEKKIEPNDLISLKLEGCDKS